MAIYTAGQIYELARQAGFQGQDAVNATAIALAESSGNTSVVNGIGAMGLWQIYDGHYPSPDRIAQMSDPLANARAAFAKFQASQQTTCGGWWPWATYNEGACHNADPNRNNAWRQFLPQATAASSGADTGPIDAPVSTVDPALASGATLVTSASAGSSSAPSFLGNQSLGKIFARLASPGFWWSAGFVVLAIVLVLAGLLIYFHKQVEQVATNVGKAAAVAA